MFPADAPTNNAPTVKLGGGNAEKLRWSAYKIARTDAKGASNALEYLIAAEAPEDCRAALREAVDSVAADAPKYVELAAAIQLLIASKQDLNGPGLTILAKLAVLSDEGRLFLNTDRTLVKPLLDFIAQNFTASDDATRASRDAYQALANGIMSPSVSGKGKGSVEVTPAPLTADELKHAEHLIANIKAMFKGVPPLATGKDAKVATNKATPAQMKTLKDAIGGAPGRVRDWVYAWKDTEAPNAGKTVLELFGSYMSPSQVEEMNAILDPVERLYQDLFDNRNGKRDPKLPKVSAYDLIHTMLSQHLSDAAVRKRVQSDARIMEPYLYFEPAAKQKILIRMIVTGREEPDAVDKVHGAADSGDSQAAIQAIFELAGKEPAKLQELRTDLIFVHRLKDKCGTKVTYNGVLTTAYELFLRCCGVDPNNTKEAGSVDKQSEANPEADKRPLDATEIATVEAKIYSPYAKPIADELNSWYTKDSTVVRLLQEFQKAAADETIVKLLRRAGQSPGPTLANRIQACGCDVRFKLGKGLSDDNLHMAERVLGFVADQATTGVIGGKGALVGDTGPVSSATVGLEQALRETTVAGGVLTQVIHGKAQEMADELGRFFGARANKIGGIWSAYKGEVNDKVCADLRTKTGMPRVWAVELLANAFLPIGGGSLESKLKSELGKDGNDVIQQMGMSPTDIAARRTVAEEGKTQQNGKTPEANSANDAMLAGAHSQVEAAAAAEQFRAPAKELFDGLATIARNADETVLRGLGGKLHAGMRMSNVTAAPAGVALGPKPAPAQENDVSAKPGGPVHPGQAAPTDFVSFYKKEFGIDPRRHAVEVAKALANKERSAKDIGALLDVFDPSLFEAPKAPTGDDEVVVNDKNITLVSPNFSAKTALDRGQKIWDIMHGQDMGAIQLIRQEFGTTQEEDRLINIAFRRLSAGIDMHFYLQQHLAQQKKWDASRQGGLDRAGVQVGGGGVGDADKRGIHVVGLSAETEVAVERAATGKVSIEKQLSTLAKANNMDETYRIIEAATPDERRAILANGDLMTTLRKFGDDSYEWARIYKGLTGQTDLYDKLESRAHGKHGLIGGAFTNTDEKGMTEDIKDHAKKRKVAIRIEVIQQLCSGIEPKTKQNKEMVDKEVGRRLRLEFQAHLENPSIRALLADELSGTELASAEGQLMNSGEESKLASVLNEGQITEDEEKILADIKKMNPAERKKARENPEYISQLRRSIQSQGTWRDAMTLLESNEDGSKGDSEDNYAKLERASRSQRQDTTELMFEQDEVIEALSKLTPDEYTRLKANPRLMAQILTSLEGHPTQLLKARQMMAFNAADAAETTGLKIVAEGKEPGPGEYAKGAVERLAFLRFSAENQLSVGASRGWGVLLQASIAVYNMKLTPSAADAAAKAQGAAQKEETDKPLEKKDLAPEGPPAVGANGQPSNKAPNGAKPAAPAGDKADAPKKDAPAPKDEAGIEADLRQKILEATRAQFTTATDAWGGQKGEGAGHDRTEIDPVKQREIVEGGILHKSDPSNVLLMASTGVFGDDEERIKETLRKASDEKLIREWTNCINFSPDMSESLKVKYLRWKNTRQKSGRGVETDEKPVPGAASPQSSEKPDDKKKKKNYVVGSDEWVARTAFKTHVVDTSEVFESLLLKYAGGLFDGAEPLKKGEKVRDNAEWLEWRTLVRERLPNLDREKIGIEIGAGADKEAMDVMRDPDAKVLSDTLAGLEYDNERYLVDRGANSNFNMDRATAEGEGLALDNAMDSYKQQVMGSVISKDDKDPDAYGNIDAAEQAKIAEAKGRFQANDGAFRDAKSQVATIASTVVALIVTAVVTILTAGTATGPLATILIAAITAGTASAGSQLTKEAIQGTDNNLGKDGLQAIARDTIMGAVTAGTTWYAGKIVNGLFSAGSAAEQAAIIARTAANPNFFLQMGRAMAENSLQTGMQGLFESGMAAFDPAMWLDGWNEGWRRGSHAARERAEEIPLEMLRAAVIAAMSHTANAGVSKLKGGAPEGGEWHGQHKQLGNRMDVGDRTALTLKNMGHGAKEGVIMGGAELLLDEKSYRAEGMKPAEMLGHIAQSSSSMAQMSSMGMHQSDAQGHAEDGAGSVRAKQAKQNLAEHGSELTPHEQKLYAELATKNGGVETQVLSVSEFKQAQHELVEKSVAKFEAQTERKLTPEERAAFERHINSAETVGDYVGRAEAGPNGAPGVKHTAIVEKFETKADQQKLQKRATDLLEKLGATTEATKGDVGKVAELRPQETAALAEGRKLLTELSNSSKAPAAAKAAVELMMRFDQLTGELSRALETAGGGSSFESLRKELQSALTTAEGSGSADSHKALNTLVVEGNVVAATGATDVAKAAENAPKKLAELKALIEEMRHARDNAARKALDAPTDNTTAGGGTDAKAIQDLAAKQAAEHKGKTEPAKDETTSKDDPKTKDEPKPKTEPTKKTGAEEFSAKDAPTLDPNDLKLAATTKEKEYGRKLTENEQNNLERLVKQFGVSEGMRLFEVTQARRQSAMPSLEDQQKLGHAGIEIHSHFMGNVSPESFRSQVEAAGVKPKEGQVSSWEPLLDQIVALKEQLGHKYEKASKDTHAIDPETGLPVVKKRGVSGDAIFQAEQAIKEINALKQKLGKEGITPEQVAEIKAQIEVKAQNAVDKAMRASDESDFNSSYEIRDELVKKFYGEGQRNAMFEKAGVSPDAGILETGEVYRKHFEGRPEVLKKLDGATESAQKANDLIEAAKRDNRPLTPEEKGVIADAKKKAAGIKEQMAYDAYAKDTLRRLAEDNIRYTEQSNSAKKLAERFDPEQLEWLKKQLMADLIAEGKPELAKAVQDLTVVHVAMINTAMFGTGDPNVDRSDVDRRERANAGDFGKEVSKVLAQTARPDVVAVDIAGSEHFLFDEVGKARFQFLCEKLLQAAIERGEPLAIRPHVGEGAVDTTPGKHFNNAKDRQTTNGELTADVRARKNIDALLDAVAALKAKHPDMDKFLTVRFGHATHTTPEQAIRMKQLGIIAEVNLESNAQTGATSPTSHDLTNGDVKRGKGDLPSTVEPDPTKRDPKLAGHSLPELVFNDVQIVLSTDAHEVMSTNLKNEYTRAGEIVDQVLAGTRLLELTPDQARSMGVNVPEGATVVPVDVRTIPPPHGEAVRAKFENARKKFLDDANKYFNEQRPKRNQDPPREGDPTSSSGGGGEKKTSAEGGDVMEHRPAENGPAVSKRFELAKEKLDAKGGAELDAFMKRAENPGQRVLLERALAAGHTLDQIHGLLLVMNGMSEAEVMSAFTGHGIVQFFAQSCVPTSYQIALAEIDPLFALKLRNNPQMVIEAQGQALKDGGGQAHKRYDTDGKEQFQDPEVKKALGDKNRYDHDSKKSSGGIESTEMKDQDLHKQLEDATGAKYEVITNDGLSYKKEGDGKFAEGTVPFDRINAALDQRLPVIIGTMMPTGHAQVIIDREVGSDGKTLYIISDPMSGTTYKLGAEAFGFLKVQSVTIPDVGGAKKTEPGKTKAVADPSKSTTTGGTDENKHDETKAKKDEATKDTTEAKQQVDKNKDNQTAETPEPAKEGDVPPAVKDGWDKSAEQKSALEGAQTGKPSEAQRELLQNEIRRQVPDVALAEHIQDPAKGGAAVVSVVFPGGGPFGIKKMNDDVLGQRFNDALIADRNGVVQKAFSESGLTVVDQNYKVVTLVSKAPAAELGAAMASALATIDAQMPAVIAKHLEIAKKYYEGELAKAKPGQETPDQKAAKKHLEEIATLQGTMNEKLAKGFAVEMGAADLHGTGYKDIVETSMNASKAAIMARDGGGGAARAHTYSEAGFVDFVQGTIAIRDGLQGMQLSIHGHPRNLIVDGKLDREILWAVRKGKLDPVSDAQLPILAELERYIKRVNSLDYMAPYTGAEIEGQGAKVKAAQEAIVALGKENLTAEDAQKIGDILKGSVAQQNAASEAQFFNAAAADKGQRIVVNADIKDMGLDLWKDLESSTQDIDAKTKAKEPDQREMLRNKSATAADNIVNRKRATHDRYLDFYEQMLAKAKQKAANDPLLLEALQKETTPMYLQGGDEITLSISPVFRQLGMEHEFVQFLFDNANARVAITDAHGGTDGHREAMKKADSGHKELKKYEEVRRAIDNAVKADQLTGDKLDTAKKLLQEIDSLYTQTSDSGETELHGRGMKPDQIRAEAAGLLGEAVIKGILGKQEGS